MMKGMLILVGLLMSTVVLAGQGMVIGSCSKAPVPQVEKPEK